MQVLHPHHHRVVTMYQANMLKLSGAQRADRCSSSTRTRTGAHVQVRALGMQRPRSHTLVANDIEGTAIALLDAGDIDAAAQAFRSGGGRLWLCYCFLNNRFYGEGPSRPAQMPCAALVPQDSVLSPITTPRTPSRHNGKSKEPYRHFFLSLSLYRTVVHVRFCGGHVLCSLAGLDRICTRICTYTSFS